MNSISGNERPLRVVIVGAGGRLGSELYKAWKNKASLLPLTRKDLDLSDPSSIYKALAFLEYDRLVITGALTAVDYCEDHEEEAFAVNVEVAALPFLVQME